MVTTFSVAYNATQDPPITGGMDVTSISTMVLAPFYLITVDNDP